VYTKTAFLKDDVHRDAKDEVTSKHWGALARVTNAEQNYALCEFWSVPVGNFKFSTEKYATRGLGLFQRRHMFLLYLHFSQLHSDTRKTVLATKTGQK
jgi:hypothetical protein